MEYKNMFSTISSNIDNKMAMEIAVCFSAVIAGVLFYFYKKKTRNDLPKKWRRVGEICEIICYPIKSCGAIRVNKVYCNQLGIEDGHLRDRVFMVVTPSGEFLTARAQPKLLLIQPVINGDKMILSAPGMMDFEIDFRNLHTGKAIKASVWYQLVEAIDCGEETAKWLSQFLNGTDVGVRLLFYPNTVPTRDIVETYFMYKELSNDDAGALHDVSSFMMMNEASVNDLNSRLDHVVTPLQFRPNFVVKGPLAFEEDDWKWIKIGRDVIFKNIKPCTSRCILSNINPETAERNRLHEPLATLKAYRSIISFDSPVMGINLGVRVKGKAVIGDAVYISDDD